MALTLLWLAACSPSATHQQGINVMFEADPHVYQQDVYYLGQPIGQVLDQASGKGSIYKVTIGLVPDYVEKAGSHWAFYVDNGSLHAVQLSSSGRSLGAGDAVCGFRSKAALNWFKIKTLLTDRAYKANEKAHGLLRRFG